MEKKFINSCFTITENGNEAKLCADKHHESAKNESLYKSVANAEIVEVYTKIMSGADVNWRNPDAEQMSCLHQAVQTPCVEMSELLLLNGAKIDAKDALGRTPVQLAIQKGLKG